MGFLDWKSKKAAKLFLEDLKVTIPGYIKRVDRIWTDMSIAEREGMLKVRFCNYTDVEREISGHTFRFRLDGKIYDFGKMVVKNPEKEAKKEFSELPEILRADIIQLVRDGFQSTQMIKDEREVEKEVEKERVASLQRMDDSNNSGMAEYNRRKEKQENFYWKYFRRTNSYIRPEWHGDKPSEDRISDEEFDGLVDEYLTGMHDSDENYEETTPFRLLNSFFVNEFAKRREAQSRFTKDSQTEDKKARRGKREISEEDLEGTHYDLLKVSMDASLKEIKEAWKELILKWHPDRHQKNPKLAERMAIALNIAKEVLSDRTKRKKYDEELDQRFV